MTNYDASIKWRGDKEIAHDLKKVIESNYSQFMNASIEKIGDDAELTIIASAETISDLRLKIDEFLVCLINFETSIINNDTDQHER